MKYIIIHKCGHEEEVTLFGKGDERKRKIAQMEAHECSECRAKHAIERDVAQGYSILKGSPKQIAWASDIRREMLDRLAIDVRERVNDYEFDWDSDLPAPENVKENYFGAQILDNCILNILRGIYEESSAKWFIEHRDARLHQLSQMFDYIPFDEMMARYSL